jgi:hypothetical protein
LVSEVLAYASTNPPLVALLFSPSCSCLAIVLPSQVRTVLRHPVEANNGVVHHVAHTFFSAARDKVREDHEGEV